MPALPPTTPGLHINPSALSLSLGSLSPLGREPASSSPRVPINLIPLHLRPLCFHTLTHSFASPKLLPPVFSIASALFPQNTGGGVGLHWRGRIAQLAFFLQLSNFAIFPHSPVTAHEPAHF
jgi:hypothetical protein